MMRRESLQRKKGGHQLVEARSSGQHGGGGVDGGLLDPSSSGQVGLESESEGLVPVVAVTL